MNHNGKSQLRLMHFLRIRPDYDLRGKLFLSNQSHDEMIVLAADHGILERQGRSGYIPEPRFWPCTAGGRLPRKTETKPTHILRATGPNTPIVVGAVVTN